MNSKKVVEYIETNRMDFSHTILKNVSLDESDIIEEINNSSLLRLLESTDWIVSHVIQKDNQTLQNSKVDNSKNSTDFIIHTDGPYHTYVPEIVGLFCINEWSKSAITYLSDTTNAIESLLQEEIEILQKLQYTYIGKDWRKYPRNLIENDPLTGLRITNLSARWFISPHIIPWKDLPDLFTSSKLINKLYQALEDSVVCEHIMEKWDLFLFNNNRYLHGRKSTTKDTQRHLLRLWISKKE